MAAQYVYRRCLLKRLIAILPGLLLCLAIALPAWLAGQAVPVIGGSVLAIVAGLVVGGLCPRLTKHAAVTGGLKFTSKKVLQASVVLLGFEMNLQRVARVGGQSLWVMLATLAAALLCAYCVGRLLALSGNTTTLIGVGTAICGGSAIAATAPVIGADDQEVAHAISTIFLFNIAAVLLFPLLGQLLHMSDTGFGLWAGTAVNDTSSVVATGAAWSSRVGNNTALQFATIVKLTRTLMIVPITLALAARTAKRSTSSGVQLRRVFPWFVVLFLAAALLNTVVACPAALAVVGKFLIVCAMAAIGLSTQLKTLVAQGVKPILLGLCCWVAVAAVSLVVQKALGVL